MKQREIFIPPNFMHLDLFYPALLHKADQDNLLTGKAGGKDVATKQV